MITDRSIKIYAHSCELNFNGTNFTRFIIFLIAEILLWTKRFVKMAEKRESLLIEMV